MHGLQDKMHQFLKNSVFSPRLPRFVIFPLSAPLFSDFQQSSLVSANQSFGQPYQLTQPVQMAQRYQMTETVQISQPYQVAQPVQMAQPYQMTQPYQITQTYQMSQPVQMAQPYQMNQPVQITQQRIHPKISVLSFPH